MYSTKLRKAKINEGRVNIASYDSGDRLFEGEIAHNPPHHTIHKLPELHPTIVILRHLVVHCTLAKYLIYDLVEVASCSGVDFIGGGAIAEL